ncbi:YlxM family DNA-binding protein [Candidatus Sumerlaeota bacterium]|nr:YlxM family DNA-binding protein [Candidatus Sumerlaeota bacterium]
METYSESLFPKVERINLLMDIYGDLLTEKQRRFLELHYSEDLSFGEIASQYNVSRQAIYDAVKHALSNLEHYEKTLSLLDKVDGHPAGETDTVGKEAPAPEKVITDFTSSLGEIVTALKQLKTRIQRQSIIYNADPIVNEITKIIGMIDAIQGNGNPYHVREK